MKVLKNIKISLEWNIKLDDENCLHIPLFYIMIAKTDIIIAFPTFNIILDWTEK